jgi:adenine-specific DNA glycosylase
MFPHGDTGLGQTICGPVPQCSKCPLRVYCGYARELASSGCSVDPGKAVKRAKKSSDLAVAVAVAVCPWSGSETVTITDQTIHQ